MPLEPLNLAILPEEAGRVKQSISVPVPREEWPLRASPGDVPT